jgi:hypothetical protein
MLISSELASEFDSGVRIILEKLGLKELVNEFITNIQHNNNNNNNNNNNYFEKKGLCAPYISLLIFDF